MRNINFALTWYITTVSTLIFSLVFLLHLSFTQSIVTPMGQNYQMYKALPSTGADFNHQEISVGKADARALIVSGFFKQYKSHLASFAGEFIEVADRYNLDFRLLPAIAMQESNGSRVMPKNSFNPFGYGIYGGQVLKFASFEDAIERVGKGLRNDYLNQGLQTPEQIMAKYTPPSLQKGGAWAIGVSSFMKELH